MSASPKNRSGVVLLAGYIGAIQAFAPDPSIYPLLQLGIYVLLGGIFFRLALDNDLRARHPLIGLMAFVALMNLALRSVASIYTGTILVGRDPLVIPLVLIVLGMSTRDRLDPRTLATVYALASLTAAWYVIITHGGLSAEGAYFVAQKNQLGAVIAGAFSLSLWAFVDSFVVHHRRSSLGRLLTLAMLVAAFAALLILRNRSSLVALMILIVLVLFKLISSRHAGVGVKMVILAGVPILLGMAGSQLWQLINDALFEGFDAGDVNNLSANRVEVYVESIGFLRTNWLFGDIANDSGIFDPHNFVLYNLVRFGLILSLGHLVVYASCLIRLVREWKGVDLFSVAPWAYPLLVAMFTSLLEYAQPFGPGSAQFLTWLLVGRGLVERRGSLWK